MQREKRWFLQTVSHCGTLPMPMVWTTMEGIPVVFTIELSNGKLADTICEATGAKKLEFATCHNVTAQAFANGATYLQLMEHNVQALREALN